MEKTQELIGKLLPKGQGRDAIHMAVCPVVAAVKLFPGQDIGLDGDKATIAAKHIGIVDPFLRCPVFPGQEFFMFLYPNTITSLRHEWTHPAFEAGAKSDEDPATVLKNFAPLVEMDYFDLMTHLDNVREGGDFITQRGAMDWQESWYENQDRVWKAYEAVRGIKLTEDQKSNTAFSCSC